ncbi:MAG: hypothetical protein JNL32_16305 [Candidatus Kapabacteria bacterium]|nr:hypothetical protein [Candidatus Kapabacteria bacterium]
MVQSRPYFPNIIIAAVVVCAMMPLFVAAAAQPDRNFLLTDTVCARAAAAFFSHPAVAPARINITVAEGTGAWVVRQHLRQTAAQRGITLTDSLGPHYDIRIAECGVRYALHPSSGDSLLRTVRVELRAGTVSSPPFTIIEHHTDAIARADVALVEVPKQEFTTAAVPPRPSSAWDDILEPLVVAATCVIIVGLLFTVRSQ